MDRTVNDIRICNKCKIEKTIDCFSTRKGSKDGLNRCCKPCVTYRKYLWSINNKDKVLKSRAKNAESISNNRKKWRENNPDYSKNYIRKYSRSKRLRDRMKVDKSLKCKISISKCIGNSIRKYINNNTSYKKPTKSEYILGCKLHFFIFYIEYHFEPWMSWENYGIYNGEFNSGWDFDHTIPVSTSKSVEEVIKLNHYTNFKPLCSKINRDIKRDRLTWINNGQVNESV